MLWTLWGTQLFLFGEGALALIRFPAYKINRGTRKPRHNIASLQGIMRRQEGEYINDKVGFGIPFTPREALEHPHVPGSCLGGTGCSGCGPDPGSRGGGPAFRAWAG